MTQREAQDIANLAHGAAREAALATAGNRVGKIVAQSSNGCYDVEERGGNVMRHVQPQGSQRWSVGQWVTVEMASARFQIVGVSAGAGDQS